MNPDGFESMIEEAEELTERRKTALSAGNPLLSLYYSQQKCTEEINCCKKMYKHGKSQNIHPYFMWLLTERAFDTARFGYKVHRSANLKREAENFARGAEKFGNILGEIIVNHGDPNWCRERRQDI